MMTGHRRNSLLPLALVAALSACGSSDDHPGDVDDPLTLCYPFAASDTEPAVSQRSSGPPEEAIPWTPPPAPPPEGPLAPDQALEGAERFGADLLQGAEDVAFDDQGRLYTGTRDGTIWRAAVDENGRPAAFESFVAVEGGGPLGLAFDACGNLVAAVPNVGLVAVSPTGEARILADRVDGTLIEFADELAIAPDGTIYATDASVKYRSAWPYDFLEGRPHGRAVAYEPSTGEVRVVVDELYFGNGILVAEDETYLLVAESLRLRIQRHWLAGPQAGTSELFAASLPVVPDNISRDAEGRIWVAGGRRTEQLEQLSSSAESKMMLIENFTLEELIELLPVNPYSLVVVLDGDGTIGDSLHDATGGGLSLSTAVPQGDLLYLGTLAGPGIALADLSARDRTLDMGSP